MSGPCGLFAMTSDQNFGVWGGRTQAESRSGTDVNRRHGAQSDEKGQAFIGSPEGPWGLPINNSSLFVG